MSKIYCIVGRSSSGKDTVKNALLQKYNFNNIVTLTTRPRREHEVNGKEYYFISNEAYEEKLKNNKILAPRIYKTKMGDWKYGVDIELIDIKKDNDYICIVTLDGYVELKKYFGKDSVRGIYLYLTNPVELLLRSLNRQATANWQQCEEICRRFLADNQDFKEIEKNFTFKVNNLNTTDTVDIILRNIKNNSI